MKYYQATLLDTETSENIIVYLRAEDPADLLPVAMDAHNKPVLDYEEISEEVYNANT